MHFWEKSSKEECKKIHVFLLLLFFKDLLLCLLSETYGQFILPRNLSLHSEILEWIVLYCIISGILLKQFIASVLSFPSLGILKLVHCYPSGSGRWKKVSGCDTERALGCQRSSVLRTWVSISSCLQTLRLRLIYTSSFSVLWGAEDRWWDFLVSTIS